MKTKLPAASLFAVLLSSTMSAQWVQQTSMSAANLIGIHCTDVNNCFTAGSTNIRKTVDGTTWSISNNGGSITNIASIKMFSLTKSWAGLINGTFRYTTNSGNNWATVTGGGTTHVLNDIWYLNDSFYVAVGGPSANTSSGGNVITKTINRGTSWSATNTSGVPSFFGIHCFSPSSYAAVAGAQSIFKTLDSGKTWTKVDSGAAAVCLFDVHFPTASRGYAVGGDPANLTTSGVMRKTSNGGNTWTSVVLPNLNVLYGVHFVNADTGFVVGNGGVILNTINGGLTWTLQTSPVSTTLNKIQLLNDSVGYICGANGVILKTTDGGGYLTTGTHNLPDNENGYSIHYLEHYEIAIETRFFMQHASCEIYNALGQVIELKKDVSGNKISIQTNYFPKGVYFFILKSSVGNFKGKFIAN